MEQTSEPRLLQVGKKAVEVMLANTCLDKNIFSVGLGAELGTNERGKHEEFTG